MSDCVSASVCVYVYVCECVYEGVLGCVYVCVKVCWIESPYAKSDIHPPTNATVVVGSDTPPWHCYPMLLVHYPMHPLIV